MNTYEMHIDWDADDDYADTGETVTGDLLTRNPVTVQRPVNNPSVVRFDLNNSSGDYSAENAGSPIFGDIGPGRPVRLRSADTSDVTFKLDAPNVPAASPWTVASCPDTANLSITGDIDLRVKVAPERWEACQYGLWKGTSGDFSYGLRMDSFGFLRMETAATVAGVLVSATSTVAVIQAGILHGQPYWIRATRDVNNGAGGNTTAFYTSSDGSAWTVLGASVVNSGTTSIANGTQTLRLWSAAGNNSFYTVQVLDGIAGTLRADPDFTSTTEWDAGAVSGSTGSDGVNTWTLAGEATIGVRHLFAGGLDDYSVDPAPEEQSATFGGLGWLGRLRGTYVSTSVRQMVAMSTCLIDLLNGAGVPSKYWPVNGFQSSTLIPYWYAEGDAYDALLQLVASEGPGACVYEDGAGRIRFEGRDRRAVNYRMVNSQADWDGASEPAFSEFVDDRGWTNIINDVNITIHRRAVTPNVVVWKYDGLPQDFDYTVVSDTAIGASVNPLVITYRPPADAVVFPAAGEAKTFEILSANPFIDAVVPVEGVDFKQFGAGFSASCSLSRTSGRSLTLTVTGSASTIGGYVSGLQLRAATLANAGAVQVKAEDTASQAIYGARIYSLDAPWMDENTARDVADLILNEYANPPVSAQVTFRTGNVEGLRITNQLERELGDRVTITDDGGWDADAHIEQVDHELSEAGLALRTTFTCRKAVTPLVASTAIFILDSSTNAVLDTDLLAY